MKRPPGKYGRGGPIQDDPKKKPYDFSKSKLVTGKTEQDLLNSGYEKQTGPDGKTYYAKQSSATRPPIQSPPTHTDTPPVNKPTAVNPGSVKKAPPFKRNTPPIAAPGGQIDNQEIVHLDTPTPPKPKAMNLDVSANKDRKIMAQNDDYITTHRPDWKGGGGWGSPIVQYYDKKTQQEIHPDVAGKSYNTGKYVPNFIPGSFMNQGENLGTTKLMSSDVNVNSVDTQLGNSKNPVLKENLPTTNNPGGLINKTNQGIGTGLIDKDKLPPTNLNTNTSTTGTGLKKGGSVKKAPRYGKKGYADGSAPGGVVVNPNNDSNYPTQNQNQNQFVYQAKNTDPYNQGLNTGVNASVAMGANTLSKSVDENGNATKAGNIGKGFGWLGAATGLKDMGQSMLQSRDKYGYLQDKNERAVNEIMTPDHEHMMNDIKNKNYTALAFDAMGLGKFARMGSSLFGQDQKDTAFNRAVGANQGFKIKQDEEEAKKKWDADQKRTGTIYNAVTKRDQQMMNEGGPVKKSVLYNAVTKNKGGIIEGPGGPKDDAISASVKEKSFVVPAENVDRAKLLKAFVLGKNPNEKADLKQSGGEDVKVSNGEMILTPPEKNVLQSVLGKHVLKSLAPNAEKENAYAEGTDEYGIDPHRENPKRKAKPVTHAVRNTSKPSALRKMFLEDYKEYPEVSGAKKTEGDPTDPRLKEKNPLNETQASIYNDTLKKGEREYSEEKKQGYKQSPFYKKIAGANFAEPAAIGLQGLLGYKFLNQAGSRPVDTNDIVDKDYNQAVETAKNNAKFGLTGDQNFQIDQANQNAVNDARFEARNLSGGNAGTAFNQERMAINDGVNGAIKKHILDMQLKNDKQSVANSLLRDRAAIKMDRSRQLFEDKMQTFQQNQKSGAGLIGNAIQNAIMLSRINDEKKAQEEQDKYNNLAY